MNYFDSKVLETFMIPEDSIVTENLGTKISNLVKNFFTFVIKILNNFINMIRNLLNKLIHGKNVNNDKKIYEENRILLGKYHETITDAFGQLTRTCELLADSLVYNGRPYVISFESYEDLSLKPEIERCFELCDKINIGLNGKVLYEDSDYLKNELSETKVKIEKIKEKLEKRIESLTTNDNIKNKFPDDDCSKVVASITSHFNKIYTLYLKTFATLEKCISPIIITNKAKIRNGEKNIYSPLVHVILAEDLGKLQKRK